MAVRSASVLKRQRQEEKKRVRNRQIRRNVRTLIKKTRKAAIDRDERADEYLREACKAIDKASSRGVVHRNNAMRKKSRLATFVTKYRSGNQVV